MQKRLCALHGGRIAGADLAVDLKQPLFGVRALVVLQRRTQFEGRADDVERLHAHARKFLERIYVERFPRVRDYLALLVGDCATRSTHRAPNYRAVLGPALSNSLTEGLESTVSSLPKVVEDLLVGGGERARPRRVV